jgi:DNA mismatch endonuclease (patch repair protein)
VQRIGFGYRQFPRKLLSMADKLSAKRRSWNMSRIKSRDTNPELVVRRVLHNLGYRFRLHRTDLPGKPDIVLPRYRIAIFVHGCFWHQHGGCIDCSNPKTNSNYWRPKLLANVQRDRNHRRRLRRLGWLPIVIWECQTKKGTQLQDRLTREFIRKSTS